MEKTTSFLRLGVSDEQSPYVRVYNKKKTVKQRYDQTQFNTKKFNFFLIKSQFSVEKKVSKLKYTST